MGVRGAFRAVAGALLLSIAVLALSGCSLFRHKANTGCTEKPFNTNTASRPPLQAPPGLSAPDTRNGVKIPTLTTPERVRAKSEPCLEDPPNYGSEPVGPPPPRQIPQPTPAPAPAAPAAPASSVPGVPAPSGSSAQEGSDSAPK